MSFLWPFFSFALFSQIRFLGLFSLPSGLYCGRFRDSPREIQNTEYSVEIITNQTNERWTKFEISSLCMVFCGRRPAQLSRLRQALRVPRLHWIRISLNSMVPAAGMISEGRIPRKLPTGRRHQHQVCYFCILQLQLQSRPIQMRIYHSNERCRISAILKHRGKLF